MKINSSEYLLFRQSEKNTISVNKFREVLVICPICVYGTLLVAWGGNMRLWCIKKIKHAL